MKTANLALRFFLELAAVLALGYAAWRLGGGGWVAVLGGLLAAGAAVGVWATWVAPKAARRLHDPARLVLEVLIFTVAFGGLALAGLARTAAVLGALYACSLVLMVLWGQRGAA